MIKIDQSIAAFVSSFLINELDLHLACAACRAEISLPLLSMENICNVLLILLRELKKFASAANWTGEDRFEASPACRYPNFKGPV
jgi:hypothetical protein